MVRYGTAVTCTVWCCYQNLESESNEAHAGPDADAGAGLDAGANADVAAAHALKEAETAGCLGLLRFAAGFHLFAPLQPQLEQSYPLHVLQALGCQPRGTGGRKSNNFWRGGYVIHRSDLGHNGHCLLPGIQNPTTHLWVCGSVIHYDNQSVRSGLITSSRRSRGVPLAGFPSAIFIQCLRGLNFDL